MINLIGGITCLVFGVVVLLMAMHRDLQVTQHGTQDRVTHQYATGAILMIASLFIM